MVLSLQPTIEPALCKLLCSTPFGINGSLTSCLSKFGARSAECSTPFGINGSLTSLRQEYDADRHRMCSTPFGINGSLTICPCQWRPERRRAQRLSASMVLSRYDFRSEDSDRLVLNAFRHQWFSHAIGDDGQMPVAICAQRLSASMVLSHLVSRIPICINQLCSTPFGINGSLTYYLPAQSVLSLSCSTPFGINGSLTSMCRGRKALSNTVLNAFRHQWFSHVIPRIAASGLTFPVCSTPFGINGSLTAWHAPGICRGS